MESYLEDNRPTIDEICESYDECNKECPLYKFCHPKTESEMKKLSWLGKNCKDCGNEKCKKLGTLLKGYDCALWQAKKGGTRNDKGRFNEISW